MQMNLNAQPYPSTGDNFLSDKETYISLNLGDSTGNKWETRNTVDGNTVTVDIKPLADCIVGMYCFNVIVVKSGCLGDIGAWW